MDKGYSRMALDGCGKFIKYSIFIVNFLIFVLGITILGLGIWAMVDGASMNKVLGDQGYANSSIILLVVGGVISFISFLGCCGAIKEVKCLLLMFFIILLLISILIVVGVVFGYKIKDKVADEFKKGLLDTIKKANEDDKKLMGAWDDLQKELHCCGADGPGDWGVKTPESCKNEDDGTYWQDGCMEAIKKKLAKLTTPLLAIGITVVVIILLAMVFSCSLFLML